VKLKPFWILALIALLAIAAFIGWVFGRWSAFRSPGMRDTCAEAEALRWIERANVQEDFRQHVVREHDMRLLSVFGLSFSTEFPGLEDTPEMQRLVHEYGSRRLESGSDSISCAEQMQLQDRIFHYAVHYNSMILGYRECPK
jgi:hypothetical protein